MEYISLPEGFQGYRFTSFEPNLTFFFAHANGIPALAYQTLFQELSQELKANIYTYDTRGMGRSKEAVAKPYTWAWELLAQDHLNIYHHLEEKYPEDFKAPKKIIFMGHSLGAWIAALTCHQVSDGQKVIPLLLDPPILKPKVAFQWAFAILTGNRNKSPLSQKARRRRKFFNNKEEALRSLSRTQLMSQWDKKTVEDYIEGTFHEDPEHPTQLVLRHDPAWEAELFESMPLSTLTGLLTIPKKYRNTLPYIFIAAKQSDACDAKAGPYIKLILKKACFKVISDARHMFPLENRELTLKTIKEVLKKSKVI
jgi:alpha-beta hydrolase superfamily lysophospholipase